MENLIMITLQSSILILALLLIRHLFFGKINPILQYSLWCIVALRLLVPIQIESVVSIFNLAAPVTPAHMMIRQTATVASGPPVEPSTNLIPTEIPSSGIPAPTFVEYSMGTQELVTAILTALWVVGMAAILIYTLIVNIRFYRRVYKTGIRKNGYILCPNLSSPCLIGFFRPRIVLNVKAEKSNTAKKYAILHEKTHLRHGDNYWALIRTICCIIYWFNPLVWIAASVCRRDQEIACDYSVTKNFDEEKSIEYGETLIALIRKQKTLPMLSTAMANNKKDIKQRLRLIADRPRMLKITAMILIASVLIVVAIACTDAVTEEPAGALGPGSESAVSMEHDPEASPMPGTSFYPTAAPQDETPVGELEYMFSNRANAGGSMLRALYGHFRTAYKDPGHFDRLLERGHLINVYAARDFKDGTLAVADFAYEGEMFPDLFYIKDGAVVSRTYGTDPWSIHYTRLSGSTIAYGKSFAWDGGILASTHAEATFMNGRTDSIAMPVTAEEKDSTTGFILIAEGDTWLGALAIYDSETLVTDDHNDQFQYSGTTRASIFGRTCYLPMYTPEVWQRRFENSDKVKLIAGGERLGMTPLYKETGALLADTWRSCEHRIMLFAVAPDALIPPEGLETGDILHVYWADISLDDGTEEGMARCLSEPIGLDSLVQGTKTGILCSTPGKPGQYVFIIETAEAYYATGFLVQK